MPRSFPDFAHQSGSISAELVSGRQTLNAAVLGSGNVYRDRQAGRHLRSRPHANDFTCQRPVWPKALPEPDVPDAVHHEIETAGLPSRSPRT